MVYNQFNQPTNQPASQPANQPAQPTQPANQPASQPASQPTNQPTSHPASQPAGTAQGPRDRPCAGPRRDSDRPGRKTPQTSPGWPAGRRQERCRPEHYVEYWRSIRMGGQVLTTTEYVPSAPNTIGAAAGETRASRAIPQVPARSGTLDQGMSPAAVRRVRRGGGGDVGGGDGDGDGVCGVCWGGSRLTHR